MDNSEHKISVQPGYVLIERAQDYKVVWSEQPAFLREISAVCKEAGCQKVLILGPRTKVRLTMSEILDLGKGIAKLGVQIAVAESHDASNEDVKFLENTVGYRGVPFKFFDNEQDAKGWLGVF